MDSARVLSCSFACRSSHNILEYAQVGAELTDEVMPLEAGLYSAVSLAKGCYIGQEIISRVTLGCEALVNRNSM